MTRAIELKMRFVANRTLRHHHADLRVDFVFFETYNPDRVIWVTSGSGTHFYRFWKNEELPKAGQRIPYLFGTATRERIVDNELEAFRDCFHEGSHDFYLVEPKTGIFRKIRKLEAVTMLAEHARNLHKLWSEEKRDMA